MSDHDLALDKDVRNWVFIPLTLSIILMKLIMQFIHIMVHSPAQAAQKQLKEIREQQSVTRSQRIRTLGGLIPEASCKMRKDYFIAKDTGVFNQKIVSPSMQEAMATDPSMMADMMKKNLTGLVPQLVMGVWVNFFFSGFVMGKIPFGLSPRFRLMLQRGIELSSLDVSYFTSLSYYIILLFGLRGAFSLVFREDTIDDAEMMKRQMNPMAGPAFDAAKAFEGEKTALGALDHEWALEECEEEAVLVIRATLGKAKAE